MNKEARAIVLIACITLLSGLLSVFLPVKEVSITENGIIHTTRENFFNGLLEPVNLDMDTRMFYSGPEGFPNRAIKLTFFAVLLLGIVLFVQSKGRKTGVLQYAFAVIFLFDVLLFVNILCWLTLFRSQYHTSASWKAILIWVCKLGWTYLAWYVLKKLASFKVLAIQTFARGDYRQEEFIEAGAWYRFFNLLLDVVPIFILLLYNIPFYASIVRSYFPDLVNHVSDYILFAICLFVTRLIYYIINESIWGATPGKFITQTIVRDAEGRKAGFAKILGRSFARFIPFDWFSFFVGRGWHDSASGTAVFVLTSERRED
jgi:uncharacterized RDD family membrane protein YckC